jgi:hypothetical protein
MAATNLPYDLQKFVSRYGYVYEDLGSTQLFRSKASFSPIVNVALALLGVFLLIGGLFVPLLFIAGFVVLLIPVLKYVQRKRFVFDLKHQKFQVKGSVFEGKKAYSFLDITAVEVNYEVADADVTAFSNSSKQHNYRIYIRATDNREHQLFFISEKEFNPIDSVAALRYTISNWINPKS